MAHAWGTEVWRGLFRKAAPGSPCPVSLCPASLRPSKGRVHPCARRGQHSHVQSLRCALALGPSEPTQSAVAWEPLDPQSVFLLNSELMSEPMRAHTSCARNPGWLLGPPLGVPFGGKPPQAPASTHLPGSVLPTGFIPHRHVAPPDLAAAPLVFVSTYPLLSFEEDTLSDSLTEPRV